MLKGTCIALRHLSSVTGDPFPSKAQKILTEVATAKKFRSPFWITLAQARRSGNTNKKLGEQPTTIFLNVEFVVPFDSLPLKTQADILTVKPPFFNTWHEVGILSGSRGSWNYIRAARLASFLNPYGDERKLFVDVDYLEAHKLKSIAPTICLKQHSSVELFNADQLRDPFKGYPQRGMILSVSTGKRIPQPAHDVLLAASLLRGYISPYWVTNAQLQRLHLKREEREVGVKASTMSGFLVPLSSVEANLRNTLTSHPSMRVECSGYFLMFGPNGWEKVRSTLLMTALSNLDKSESFWVCIEDAEAHLDESILLPSKVPKLDTSSVTAQVFYNACQTTKPHLCNFASRPIALHKGKLLSSLMERKLRTYALKRKFSCPVWVCRRTMKQLGVTVLQAEKDNSVVLSKGGPPLLEFYNLDDLEDAAGILEQFPVPHRLTAAYHSMLETQWRSSTGSARLKYLDSLQRRSKLWVTAAEVVISGFGVKQGVVPYTYSAGSLIEKGERVLWNAEQTTNPLRVMGLSPYLTRPQGYFA